MTDLFTRFALKMMDACLGWTLALPSDVTLFLVSIGSALVLAGVRVWTSDQDLLRRCKEDRQRLKSLAREAKLRKDKSSLQRHRKTLGMIGLKQMRQEGKPFLAALVPLVLLATWAFYRLEFHPVKAGEPVDFTATFAIAAIGKITHLVPPDGVTAESGWIQEIRPAQTGDAPHGTATWKLRAGGRAEPYLLQIRFAGQTYEHPLRAGGRTYEPPRKTHDAVVLETEVKLRPVQLFGVVPGIPALRCAPWLVAYLLIVIPFVVILKRVLRIC